MNRYRSNNYEARAGGSECKWVSFRSEAYLEMFLVISSCVVQSSDELCLQFHNFMLLSTPPLHIFSDKNMNDYQQYPMPHEGGGYSQTAAVGASNRVRLAKEELICPLCMSFYKNPRSLQCLHSYCEECLVGLHGSSKCNDTVQCPECRARTLLPGGGIQGKFCKLDSFHSLRSYILANELTNVSMP